MWIVLVAAALIGIPGVASAEALPAIPSDFNGDGYADLAIGTPGAQVGKERGAGSVAILYGSDTGLTADGDQRWTQESPGIAGRSEGCGRRNCEDEADGFGTVVASGDFDRDGFADLAVGVPFDRVGGLDDVGAVNVIYGSRTGLRADGDQRWSEANLPGAPATGERFGAALVAGDFDGDRFSDLAIGVLEDPVGGVQSAGLVLVLRGTREGLTAAGVRTLTRPMTGVADLPYQAFGAALATGKLDVDGFADLAIGTPDHHCNSSDCSTSGGEVAVLYGSANGPGATRIERWTQDSPEILDEAESDDFFGSSIAIGDFNADSFGDLAVGTLREKVVDCGPYCLGQGAVSVIYGSAAGLVAAGNQVWHQGTPGVPGTPEPNDAFGTTLEAGDFNGDGADELAIGIPNEGPTDAPFAGSVLVLQGSPGVGLVTDGVRSWSEATSGVPGAREAGDMFGLSLAAADFGRRGLPELAIGAPGDGSGRVYVLEGRSAGLSDHGVHSWSLATPGVKGDPSRGHRFGWSLTP